MKQLLYIGCEPTPTHELSYDGNEEEGGDVPETQQMQEGDVITVPNNPGNLWQSGKVFLKWNTSADGSGTSYVPGDKLTMSTKDV